MKLGLCDLRETTKILLKKTLRVQELGGVDDEVVDQCGCFFERDRIVRAVIDTTGALGWFVCHLIIII